jgi:hypothetical protein
LRGTRVSTQFYSRKSRKVGCSIRKLIPDGDGVVNSSLITDGTAKRKIGNEKMTAHPFQLAKKTNSDSAKLNMQKKADAKKVAHHKAVNRNWKECKVWCDVGRRSRADDDSPRPQFQKRAIQFEPLEEPGPVLSQFNRVSNPLGVYKSMLGGEITLYLLRKATNDYIAEFWSSRKTPPSRKVGGKPEGRLIGPRLPAGGFVTDQELVASFGIQFLIGYHRLPELSMFWEQQPDAGLGLGIIQQAMTRERFKFITKHRACASP